MCLSSMSPFTVSNVAPDSSFGSIFDSLSTIEKMEETEVLALEASGPKELD